DAGEDVRGGPTNGDHRGRGQGDTGHHDQRPDVHLDDDGPAALRPPAAVGVADRRPGRGGGTIGRDRGGRLVCLVAHGPTVGERRPTPARYGTARDRTVAATSRPRRTDHRGHGGHGGPRRRRRARRPARLRGRPRAAVVGGGRGGRRRDDRPDRRPARQ